MMNRLFCSYNIDVYALIIMILSHLLHVLVQSVEIIIYKIHTHIGLISNSMISCIVFGINSSRNAG